MSSISANQRVSKRSLTLNKSFLLSIFFHTVLIFGVTFTTFYKIPLIDESPIINVKFANSSQDSIGELNDSINNTFESNTSKEGTFTKKVERKTVSRWGILGFKNRSKNSFLINEVIEKPKLREAPSNYAIIGRYILPKKISGATYAGLPKRDDNLVSSSNSIA